MMYLNVSITAFLARYPVLRQNYPLICQCGKKVYDARVFVTKKCIGFIHENCECGTPSVSISIPRTEESNKKLLSCLQVFSDYAKVFSDDL
jgi:hypothetical protein